MRNFPAPWGECPRCGFKVRLNKLCKEWTGLRVCGACHDPRPADTRPAHFKPEGVALLCASPETTLIFREEGDFGGDDL